MKRITSSMDHKLKRFNEAIETLPTYRLTLYVLVAAFLALLPEWLNYDILSRDGAHLYLPVADLFLHGRFHDAISGPYHPIYPLPLYEFLTFLVAEVFRFDLELSGRLVSAAAYIFGAVGIYKVSELLFKNKIISLLSVVFYLSNRELLDRADDCLKESLLVCLVVWGNYFVLKGIDTLNRAKNFTIGTLFFVSGALVRSTSLIFLIAWLLIWVFHKKDGLVKRMLVFLLPIFTIIFLWFFRDSLPIIVRRIFIRSYNLKSIFYIDIGFFNTLKATLYFMDQFIDRTHYLVGLFGIYGIYLLKKNTYAVHLSIVLFLLYVVCIRTGWNLTGYASDRYILLGIIWLIPIAACAVFSSIKSKNKLLKTLAVLTIIACPFLWAGKAFDPPDPDKLIRKEIGQWIMSQAGPGTKVITDRERVAFYAKGEIYKFKDMKKVSKDKQTLAYRNPDWERIFLGDLKDFKEKKITIAIDVEHENARMLAERLDDLGYTPDRKFGTIYVYLPKKDAGTGKS